MNKFKYINFYKINLKHFTEKKYFVGVNLYDSIKEIKIGVVDILGNKVSSKIVKCEGLNFKDENYLKLLRLKKLEEICKKFLKFSLDGKNTRFKYASR
jgi:hypothetical protein